MALKLRVLVALAPMVCLGGCLTAEQIAAQQDAKQDATCRSFGAAPGSPSYVDCRLRLVQMQSQNDTSNATALGQRLGNVPNCANLPAAQAFACGAGGTR